MYSDVSKCENIGLDRAHQELEHDDADDEDERQQADHRAHQPLGVEAVDDEVAEHLDEDVTGDHRHEQSQREAERAHQERDELDRHDQELENERACPWARTRRRSAARASRSRRPARFQKLMIAITPGDRELAGDGEGMDARNDPERHQAHQIGKQDEDEDGEYPRHVFAPFGADIGVEHVGDEAGDAFDRDLPAAGDQLTLHPAEHEHPDRNRARSASTARCW